MAIYCWGSTPHGELGLGGIEEEQILSPRTMNWPSESQVVQVGCGRYHTIFLTIDGKVYSCGCNDNGQLGHELPTKKRRMSTIELIANLDSSVIIQVSCGSQHSMALNAWGQLYAWGNNEYGQLGLTDSVEMVNKPKIVKELLTRIIVQVACGSDHCLALTSCGELYAWGSNQYGQLGIGSSKEVSNSTKPRQITSLKGIPVGFIACGDHHCFIISKSGAVYGWGKNQNGQLGLNDELDRDYPSQLKTLRSLSVRYIACGADHSVFLTNDGGVFTCGCGSYGQLGHGTNSNELLPRKNMELMGSTITQVACGKYHTLALVPSRGRVYAFGQGHCGQLGTHAKIDVNTPQVVVGPWASLSGSSLLDSEDNDDSSQTLTVKQIFCGGNHSIITTAFYKDKVPAVDCRLYDSKSQILSMNLELAQKCVQLKKEDDVDMNLLSSLETIFRSQSCINGSFLLADLEQCTSRHHGVDLHEAKQVFDALRNIEKEGIKNTIWDNVKRELLPSLISSPADVETLRIYLILPFYHEFVNSKNYHSLHSPFCAAVRSLDKIPKKIIALWWSNISSEMFENMVMQFRNVIAYIISFRMGPSARTEEESGQESRAIKYNSSLVNILEFLEFLHEINYKQRKDKVHHELFNWPELLDHCDICLEYFNWNNKPKSLNICNYPFLFDAVTKTRILQTDSVIEMHNAMQTAASSGMVSLSVNEQFVTLNVSRQNLLQDTLHEIGEVSVADLKKPLKIKFHDEEAEDAGGVRKEFFMLLLKDLFDPKYCMFKEFSDSRVLWFSEITFETADMYSLIGVLCGLAIYNFTIINLPFPLALYKKLLNEPVDLSDLKELSPVVGKSMEILLAYDDADFEEIFDLTFVITRDIFGEAKSEPLKANGEEIPVTNDNKKEFVDLYVDFIFNKSIEQYFNAFHQGFSRVCSGRVLNIFQPKELMAVVVGNEEYDWVALESNCKYRNGYTSQDQTVRWFWQVFHELPLEEKKKFLLFLTGSDRIPIQGMGAIEIIMHPTNDDRFLPVAHTCFNLLDLPRYKTKERLKFKLSQAIQQTQGFSLV